MEVGLWQHSDVHRDGAVVIVNSADEEDAAEDDESERGDLLSAILASLVTT